jgi:hypothetical protein
VGPSTKSAGLRDHTVLFDELRALIIAFFLEIIVRYYVLQLTAMDCTVFVFLSLRKRKTSFAVFAPPAVRMSGFLDIGRLLGFHLEVLKKLKLCSSTANAMHE